MKRKLVILVSCLSWIAGLAAVPAEEVYQISCALDPLLKAETLWKLTPEKLDQEFAADGFPSSPFFQVAKEEGKIRFARFSSRPFSNVRSKLQLFESIPVTEAIVEFDEGTANRMRLKLFEGASEEQAREAFESCASALKDRLGTEPESWSYQHDPSDARQEMVEKAGVRLEGESVASRSEGLLWRGESGLALLDHVVQEPGGSRVRLRMVPPGKEPQLLVEEFLEGFNSGLLPCSLDPLFQFPDAWRMSPDDLESLFPVPDGITLKSNPYFRWLTTSKDRAIFYRRPFTNRYVDLRIFGGTIPVEEAVVDFDRGRLSSVSISVYNVGDSGEISPSEFESLFRECGRELGKAMGVKASLRPPDTRTGIDVKGYRWVNKSRGMAQLDYNPEAMDKRAPEPEYLRLILKPRPVDQIGVRTMQLVRNVKKEANGDTWIPGIPMVDQGYKGYCVVAACQRVFEYYRVPIDQHQIAPLFNSDADKGTDINEMDAALQLVAHKFHTKFGELMRRTYYVGGSSRVSMSSSEFRQMVQQHIDKGIPLLWAMRLDRLPDPNSPASQGGMVGHMRLITGYNSQEGSIIFTDTWGLGHEKKKAPLGKAYEATTRVFRFEPKMQ